MNTFESIGFSRAKTLTAAALLGLCANVQAGEMPLGGIAGYITQETLDAGGGIEPDGTGFGVAGWVDVGSGLFLSGEYQTVELEQGAFSADLNQLRIGGGYWMPLDQTYSAFVRAEWIDTELDGGGASSDADGWGLHLGGMAFLAPQFSVYGSIGQVDVDDSDGLEFLVGGEMMLSPTLAAFIEYRNWSPDDGDLSDLRGGLSFYFMR